MTQYDNTINELIEALRMKISSMPTKAQISELNKVKLRLHDISPFKAEPVDCVIWLDQSLVTANDYNPNSVAPPEMKLLQTSIEEDGYTQPIVAWNKGSDTYEVVDGFHRNRVGKENKVIKKRVHGCLPVTVINTEKTDRSDRMASTIRHNRARGKHSVDSMSEIVVELKKRNWSDSKIAKNLGMDEDEILRLTQISGLTEMFTDVDFSRAWDVGIFDDNSSELELENEET